MNRSTQICGAMAVGAGLMYLFDPIAGKRRRARLRDTANGAIHDCNDFLDSAKRDINNRALGYLAEARAVLKSDDAPDAVIAERVRATLGRIVTHPHSIHVEIDNGKVTLTGPILFKEVTPLRRAVSGVRGVREVVDQLEAYEQAGEVPGLQGSSLRIGRRPEFLQENWAPGPRLLACVAGCGMAAFGAKRGGALGRLLEAMGLGLVVRGVTNLEMQRMIGTNGGRKAVTIQKTININASPDEVFRFWSDYRNFPKFMHHVNEVRDLGDGRSHWIVDGPAGTKTQWDAEITEYIPSEKIAWKTSDNHQIAHAGSVQFHPNRNGGTQVHIQMHYNPPAGAFGHLVARLLGTDPKSEMDDDLARMKTMIETGKPPRDAAQKPAAELPPVAG